MLLIIIIKLTIIIPTYKIHEVASIIICDTRGTRRKLGDEFPKIRGQAHELSHVLHISWNRRVENSFYFTTSRLDAVFRNLVSQIKIRRAKKWHFLMF
jgi:hypothetical protein